ncbi:hypothetical protein HK103_007432 [Boothiomyces macroporosus]|uniref:BTB domain-containing protein n=1 Tax=Boothiomyces macroporosus TaxID=261099 RepID=A0AAD5Y5Q1_9FUNG|nr:hypothetical protein HK103_007432 [Boothiomyces macroporosus]
MIDYPHTLEFPIHLKLGTEIFQITQDLYKKIPQNSSLFNIITPQSNYKINKDEDGNTLILNDIKPQVFRLMLEYVQTGNKVDLLIKSCKHRQELVSAFEYFCIELPQEFKHENELKGALTKGAQVRDRNCQAYHRIQDIEFDSIVEAFLPIACKISKILCADLNRYFELERKANPDTYSDDNVEFTLHLHDNKITARLWYKGIQVLFTDHFKCEYSENNLAALSFTFLSVLWGMGYSKDETRKLCFGKPCEFMTTFRARFLE